MSLNGGSLAITGPAGLDTTGDMALSTGTLQAIGPAPFHIGGDWIGGQDQFSPGHSTVFLSSTCTITGTNHFYNLTATTPGQAITLSTNDTQTIAHIFTFSGSSGTRSILRSSTSGTLANFINLGTSFVDHVAVTDIDAFGGQVITASDSLLTHTVNWAYSSLLLTPQPVTQVAGTLSGGGSSLTYSWAPVTTYTDGSSEDPGVGTTYEITQYSDLSHLENGTAIAAGLLANSFGPVSAETNPTVYYGIKAVINNVKSDAFYVDNHSIPNYVFAATNGAGYVVVPPTLEGPFSGIALPYVWLSLTTQAAPSEGGVLASASLQIRTRGQGLSVTDYHFSPPGVSMVLEAPAPSPTDEAAFPVQMSVGGAWKTVGTADYSATRNAFIFTVYQTGVYRVGADPQGGMSSILQSVHPRIFSPNGDGYNDIVHFDLVNPGAVPATGEIFDLRGGKVSTLKPSPLGLQWDGRGPGGRIVPGGVYIYQIHIGHQRVNGTVVVVK